MTTLPSNIVAVQVYDTINDWRRVQRVRGNAATFRQMLERYPDRLSKAWKNPEWEVRYAIQAIAYSSEHGEEIVADNGGRGGAVRVFSLRRRSAARVSGLGSAVATHEKETAGAFELVEHEIRQAQLALDNHAARGNSRDRAALVEALERLSFWMGRAHESQIHGNPAGRGGVVNPMNRAISMQARLRVVLAASCGGSR